jgi:hypothetical protein
LTYGVLAWAPGARRVVDLGIRGRIVDAFQSIDGQKIPAG